MAEHYYTSREREVDFWEEKYFDNWQEDESGRKFSSLRQRAEFEYRKRRQIPQFTTEESKAKAREEYYENIEEGLNGLISWASTSDEENDQYSDFIEEYGHNDQIAIRQARAYLKAFEGAELDIYDKGKYEELKHALNFMMQRESLSPYYELKETQRKIRRYQKEKEKDPSRAEEYQKKIDDLQNSIYDFLDNCENEGLDREIAEEYLEDAKANIYQEELLAQRSRFKIDPDLARKSQPNPNASHPQRSQTQQQRQTVPQQTQPTAPQQTQPAQPTQSTETKVEKVDMTEIRHQQLEDLWNFPDFVPTQNDVDYVNERLSFFQKMVEKFNKIKEVIIQKMYDYSSQRVAPQRQQENQNQQDQGMHR